MVRINQHYQNRRNNQIQNINAPIRIRSHNIEQDHLNLISYRNAMRQYNSIRNSNIIQEVDNINLNLIRDNIFNEYISEIEPTEIEPTEIDSWMQPPHISPILFCTENSSLPSYEEILPPPMYVKELPKLPKLPSYSPPILTQAEIDEKKRLEKIAKLHKEQQKKRENRIKKRKRTNELNLDKESIETHWDGFGKFCDGCLGGIVFTGGLSLAFIPIGFVFCGGYFCGKYIKYKIKKNIYKLL
jgi:hypothetical protein